MLGGDGFVRTVLFDRVGDGEGLPSLEGYIIDKDVLLGLMDRCRALNLYRFHKDGLAMYLSEGGKMSVFVHEGYATVIRTVNAYYQANRDMLCAEKRAQLFPADRPVRTKNHEGVSTYYGADASTHRSLVADNCIIEGQIENCIVFSGVRIGKGAKVKDSILMRRCVVGENCELSHVISDKACTFSAGTVLTGNEKLPIVVPKHSRV